MPVLYRRGLLESTRVTMIAPEYISPNPDQPRRYFDPDGLSELADSIRAHGILQPLSVRRKGGGRYELIAGERRLRAAMICGLEQVPCLVLEVSRESSCLLSLIENLQRRDLDFWEEAKALERLTTVYGLSQEEAAAKVGKSQSAVANKLRLLRLPQDVLSLLRKNGFTERHARALLRLPTAEAQQEAAALLGLGGSEHGVDSLTAPKAPAGLAAALAQKLGCVVLLSGTEDLIVDGQQLCTVRGGSDRMRTVTGAGCMLSVLCGAFAAVQPGDAFTAAVQAARFWKACAEQAEDHAAGAGSFRVALFDAAGSMTDEVFAGK